MYQNVKNVCYFTPDTKQEHSQRPVAHFSGHSYSRSTHGGCALLLLWYSRGEVSAGLNVCMNMKRCNAESGLTRGSGLVCCSPRSNENCTRPHTLKGTVTRRDRREDTGVQHIKTSTFCLNFSSGLPCSWKSTSSYEYIDKWGILCSRLLVI